MHYYCPSVAFAFDLFFLVFYMSSLLSLSALVSVFLSDRASVAACKRRCRRCAACSEQGLKVVQQKMGEGEGLSVRTHCLARVSWSNSLAIVTPSCRSCTSGGICFGDKAVETGTETCLTPGGSGVGVVQACVGRFMQTYLPREGGRVKGRGPSPAVEPFPWLCFCPNGNTQPLLLCV